MYLQTLVFIIWLKITLLKAMQLVHYQDAKFLCMAEDLDLEHFLNIKSSNNPSESTKQIYFLIFAHH
jgi:hypothetical protein